jgi:hypothetical protein
MIYDMMKHTHKYSIYINIIMTMLASTLRRRRWKALLFEAVTEPEILGCGGDRVNKK